ncbi:hypothetical protein L6164_024357 [Bauhinia variegata]|uniref:Uncharacterized protein n=1 Tax=Bauhinia variegata TaxID=167791 RepID=A0ACB9LXC0_BAUVA|nr:hypothetical protein L6164_024357 [Bauhinia variegata]
MSASVENDAEALQASEAQNNVLRLRAILNSLSKLNEAGYFDQVENTIAELVTFLDSILEAALSDPNNENQKNNAFEVLSNIYQYICSPVDQAVVDVLSFELPKAVSKFSSISNRFSDMAISIIDQLIERCGPRDMHSSLCSALTYSSEMTEASNYIIPPLVGLSKVFMSTQRRHFEQARVAIPIILNVLKAVSLGSDDAETEGVFERAVEIANSIYAVCTKLEGDANEKLRALLGLYVLQCTALVSGSINYKAPSCHSIVLHLSRFSSYCGLSYLNLVTSYDVDAVASFVFGDKDSMSCLSFVKHGAALSVIWGYISDEIAHAGGEDLSAFKNVLLSNQIKRWQAIGTLKHILSSVNLPWELKKHTVNFLLCITDGHNSRKNEDEHSEWSTHMPNIYSALQAVKTVIMYAPDTELRKNSFDVLKRVLADIPISQRFDIFKALITNTDSSSMIAILIDLIRREMHMEICNNKPTGNEVLQTGDETFPELSFWNPSVLELVELVLRPPQGGPPSLPEQSDAVLSALNLYRFTLMTECTGKTNHTGVLSRRNLNKAYNEWLLPLRTLVTGILAENKNDYDQLAVDTVCTLNPMELVLYRCMELVEEKLKQSTS